MYVNLCLNMSLVVFSSSDVVSRTVLRDCFSGARVKQARQEQQIGRYTLRDNVVSEKSALASSAG